MIDPDDEVTDKVCVALVTTGFRTWGNAPLRCTSCSAVVHHRRTCADCQQLQADLTCEELIPDMYSDADVDLPQHLPFTFTLPSRRSTVPWSAWAGSVAVAILCAILLMWATQAPPRGDTLLHAVAID